VIDIKCKVNGKTYRGQHFWKHYCRKCEYQDSTTFRDNYMLCPNLVYYESYKPKRNKKNWWGTGKPGEQARIPDAGY